MSIDTELRELREALDAARQDGVSTGSAGLALDTFAAMVRDGADRHILIGITRKKVYEQCPIIEQYVALGDKGLSGFARLRQARIDRLAAQFQQAIDEGIVQQPETQEIAQFVLMFQKRVNDKVALDAFFLTIGKKWPIFGQYVGVPVPQDVLSAAHAVRESAALPDAAKQPSNPAEIARVFLERTLADGDTSGLERWCIPYLTMIVVDPDQRQYKGPAGVGQGLEYVRGTLGGGKLSLVFDQVSEAADGAFFTLTSPHPEVLKYWDVGATVGDDGRITGVVALSRTHTTPAVDRPAAGDPLTDRRFCSGCGTKLEPDWRFCMGCGLKLTP